MQRIATTVDIINQGLAGLSKDGLRMLQQESSTFLEALIKFNTYVPLSPSWTLTDVGTLLSESS